LDDVSEYSFSIMPTYSQWYWRLVIVQANNWGGTHFCYPKYAKVDEDLWQGTSPCMNTIWGVYSAESPIRKTSWYSCEPSLGSGFCNHLILLLLISQWYVPLFQSLTSILAFVSAIYWPPNIATCVTQCSNSGFVGKNNLIPIRNCKRQICLTPLNSSLYLWLR